MVRIFEIELYGEEVEKYCKKTDAEKKEFIKRATAQTDDAVIDAFIAKPLIHSDGKACCGGHNHKHDAKPETSPATSKTANASGIASNGSGGSGKGGR